jgi:hypothetical protein
MAMKIAHLLVVSMTALLLGACGTGDVVGRDDEDVAGFEDDGEGGFDDEAGFYDDTDLLRRRPGGGGGGGGGGGSTSGIPQVTGLSVYVSGPTEANLTWNSVPNATTYWIYRDTYVPAIVTSTYYNDRSLSPGTTYTYAIAAVVNSQLGPKSAPVTVTTPQ